MLSSMSKVRVSVPIVTVFVVGVKPIDRNEKLKVPGFT
jgi:hypothetical protein